MPLDFDLNDEQQDALLNNPKMLAFFAAWNLMNWDEKRLAYEGIMDQAPQNKPFMGLVPPDVQKMIAYSTAGTLMKLARVNKFFYALASDDNVWKRMFARDYPEDFAFCRGELPFFILTRDHPLYLPGSIPEFENMPWKRFYLKIEHEYRVFARILQDQLVEMSVLPQYRQRDLIMSIDVNIAGARAIYHWVRDVTRKRAEIWTKEHSFSYRASLAWLFIRGFVALTQTVDDQGSRIRCINQFWSYANTRKWMWIYLRFMSTLRNQGSKMDSAYLVFPTGPKIWQWLQNTFEDDGDERRRIETTLTSWTANDWDVFSQTQRNHLESLLSAAVKNNVLFPSFENLNYEERLVETQGFLKFFDLLAACWYHPCVLNLYLSYDRFVDPLLLAHLAFNSQEVKESVSNVMNTLNPGTVLMSLTRRREPILSNPIDEGRLRPIFYPWTRRNWHNLIRVNPEMYMLRFHPVYFKTIMSRFMDVPRHQGKLAYMERPMCIACGAIPILPKQCGGVCGDAKAIYCNADCQRAHWHKGHAQVCGTK